jgi:hypothetical protein
MISCAGRRAGREPVRRAAGRGRPALLGHAAPGRGGPVARALPERRMRRVPGAGAAARLSCGAQVCGTAGPQAAARGAARQCARRCPGSGPLLGRRAVAAQTLKPECQQRAVRHERRGMSGVGGQPCRPASELRPEALLNFVCSGALLRHGPGCGRARDARRRRGPSARGAPALAAGGGARAARGRARMAALPGRPLAAAGASLRARPRNARACPGPQMSRSRHVHT